MRFDCKAIKDTPLFEGIEERDVESMMTCLAAHVRTYAKEQTVFSAGDRGIAAGIVLSGGVHIIKEDFWGNRSIISELGPGELFGEVYAAMTSEPPEVGVIAVQQSEILFMDVKKIMTVCSSACEFHTRLIHNLLSVMAMKNLLLTRKLEYVTQRTTRDKLLSYLSAESQRRKRTTFTIPFNRQQLADYLAVDRSAMSKELCRLRDEGVIKFDKSRFELYQRIDG